jgi:hypothetical protein
MSTRSALAGAAATTVVFAALGSPAVVDAAQDSEIRALTQSLTGFADWDTAGEPADVVGGTAVRIGVAVLIAGLLCALAGRAHSRGAAFIAGWGAATVGAAAAGALFHVYEVAVVNGGDTSGTSYADALVEEVNRGAVFGLWTGWFVGAAVAAVARPSHAVAPAGAHVSAPTAVPTAVAAGAGPWTAGAGAPAAATAAGPHVSEPPAPWWAPTWGAESGSGFRPGPTAFPPGGLPASTARPVAPEGPPPPATPPPGTTAPPATAADRNADRGVTHELSTASGDPHPSDPDATQAVANPLADAGHPTAGRDDRAAGSPDAQTPGPGAAHAGGQDPDTTTVADAVGPDPDADADVDATTIDEPATRDHTIPIRHDPD